MIIPKSILNTIYLHLPSDYVALIGQRRIGMTKTVNALISTPIPETIFLAPQLPKGLDNKSDLIELFLDRLLISIKQVQEEIALEKMRNALQLYNHRSTEFQLRKILDILGNSILASRCVIVLDRLDLLPEDQITSFLFLLRDYHLQLDRRGTPGERLRFIVSGHEKTWKLCAEKSPNRSPFNIAKPVFMEGLTADDLANAINDTSSTFIKDLIVEFNGIPWMIAEILQGKNVQKVYSNLLGKVQIQWNSMDVAVRDMLQTLAQSSEIGDIPCNTDYRCPQIPDIAEPYLSAFWHGFLWIRNQHLTFSTYIHKQFILDRTELSANEDEIILPQKGDNEATKKLQQYSIPNEEWLHHLRQCNSPREREHEKMKNPMPVRVFISYAWEDEKFKTWVQKLATRLRHDGVDARLDAWHNDDGATIPEFMNRELRQADKILILCSPKYRSKVHDTEDGKKSYAAGWESMLVGSAMFGDIENRRKIVVALAKGEWDESAPAYLRGFPYFDISSLDQFEMGYRKLLQHITGKTEKAPDLGKLPMDLEPDSVDPLRGIKKY